MSDQKTLGQVAFEALEAFNQNLPHWDRAPDWVRVKWEHIAQVVLEAVGVKELMARGAAEERERLIALFEAHPLEDWTSRELVQILRCNGGKP